MYALHCSPRQARWNRGVGFLAIALVATLLGFLLSAPPARAAQTAEQFVTASVEKGSIILNDRTLKAEERQEHFRRFLLSITDPRRVAIFTLGPYARSASTAQLDAYVESFTDYLVAVYQKGLDAYRGQTIRVTDSILRSDNDAVVNAEIIGAETTSPPLRIAFRVRKNEAGSFVVTDLQVAGAWLALSERADFTAYLQQHRGDIGALSEELKMRAAQIRSGQKTSQAA
jgi:phospholipid transport system substrate-binding protein